MYVIQLVYSRDCPWCRAIAWFVGLLDLAGLVDLVAIESEKGQHLVREWHDGEDVHAPHLRFRSRLYWGIKAVAWRTVLILPLLFLAGLFIQAWRTIVTVVIRRG